MLTFDNAPIVGRHTSLVAQRPEFVVTRRYFWGLRGMSEIRSGTSMYSISCKLWLFDNFASALELHDEIGALYRRVLDHGTLVESKEANGTGMDQTFTECTFEGFERLPIQGREDAGPIEDIAGTLDGGWWCFGALHWTKFGEI